MIILGIDPGFAIVGYGVIEYIGNKFKVIEYGSVTTKAGEKLEHRLEKIYDELDEIIKKYDIADVAIEELFFNTNTKTAIHVAEARGVITLCMRKNKIDIHEYTPLQVKQAVVGYGRADKKQIQQMVKSFLKLEKMPRLDDTTDALAIAICHAHSHKMNNITDRKK